MEINKKTEPLVTRSSSAPFSRVKGDRTLKRAEAKRISEKFGKPVESVVSFEQRIADFESGSMNYSTFSKFQKFKIFISRLMPENAREL